MPSGRRTAIAAAGVLVVVVGVAVVGVPGGTPSGAADAGDGSGTTGPTTAGSNTPAPPGTDATTRATSTPVDSDGDGLSDEREEELGTDPTVADTDGDGLDDGAELDNGTDPTVADTDGDALRDGKEIYYGTDPTVADTDGDGEIDGQEVAVGTDPTKADRDDDGLSDSREKELGTDPTVADTDGDGIEDGREVEQGTDPTMKDTDGDGLSDERELTELTSDPTEVDSDGDGLTDPEEVAGPTDPARADTDGDGLSDPRELELGTNPVLADSDGDGVDDATEVAGDGDPLDADPDGDGLDGAAETKYGSSPTDADTDDDGLSDPREVELGTDPGDDDTDGDGLPDPVEVDPPAALSEADPLRMDVFVELDYMGEVPFPEEELDRVVEAYAEAPVENPDGSTGVDLHVVVDDQVPSRPKTDLYRRPDNGVEDFPTLRNRHFDNAGMGYHYAMAVIDVRSQGSDDLGGVAPNANTTFLLNNYDDPRRAVGVFTHELGHSIGLVPQAFGGIDSYEVPFEDYPSAMNYNAPYGYVNYTSDDDGGEGFDDWAYFASNPAVPPTGNLSWAGNEESAASGSVRTPSPDAGLQRSLEVVSNFDPRQIHVVRSTASPTSTP
jgi:hypothetical protein